MKTRIEVALGPEQRTVISVLAGNAGKTDVEFITEVCQNAIDTLVSSFDNTQMDDMKRVLELLRFEPRKVL